MKTQLIGLIVRLANLMLDYLHIRKREADYAERQEKRDNAADDPGGAFSDHFSDRVRPVEDSGSEDAAEADEADPGSGSKG